ncbi:MAG TPA: fructosamine kinase family protein [Acidimicrobiia bacterium]|jgi:fructosamine-3-kinase|nr:fructosamine kinase family protein [Acidimicrobiia bacterium]
MDDALRATIERALGSAIVDARRVHGGDVAVAYAVALDDGRRVFAKTHPSAPPNFFTTEAAGLAWLREPAVIPVPEVLAVSDAPPNHLVLEWIDEGGRASNDDAEAALGTALATLHAAGAPAFGREDRRSTGSRGLPNEPAATWAEFYRDNRLLPLARLARDANALPGSAIAQLERVAAHLEDHGAADEPPARLHGDLWAGNRLVDGRGRSWLIDPAAHGGHREFDLAMMRLFGGFGARCFDAYDAAWPLETGWQDRVTLHQIAPLVVHAIKFGGSYVAAAQRAIATYA